MTTRQLGDYPLVTIVTPSFNQAQFIKATIESVLTQDYPNVEYIILDGDSTDRTAEVVRPYLDRLTFISEPDYGQSDAINKGFALACGEIVAWLNSDDVFLPGAISNAVAAFTRNPQAGVVYGEGYQIDAEGNIKERFPHTQHFDAWKLTFVSDYILQQTVFFKKTALDTVGPIRNDLHYVMDWDILIRLAKRFEFVRLPEFMGCLREYETAKTFSGGGKRAREILGMLRGHCGQMYPPGYLIYGFSAYEQLWTAAIDRWPQPLKPVAKLLRNLVSKACFRVINAAMSYGQAWHRDGWMGPKAHVMLPEGSGEAVIRGLVPGNVPGLKTQTLVVRHRRKLLALKEFKPGEFEFRVSIPETNVRCPIITIEASHRFILSQVTESIDHRKLSIYLSEVRWSEPKNSLTISLEQSA